MLSKGYPWQKNPSSDSDLYQEYDLHSLSEEIFFLQNPWILDLEDPRILVIGASN